MIKLKKSKIALLSLAGILISALAAVGVLSITTGSAGAENSQKQAVDVVLFIGQSNMAGRGDGSKATQVGEGHGFEFRAISDPTKLYPVSEPFGVNENNSESGVTENKKSGSMVSAFVESYYQTTGVPIVAVSCSKGGTGINFWDTNRPAYADACARTNAARAFITNSSEFLLRNTFVVWLQGETDADNYVPAARYTKTLTKIMAGFAKDIEANHSFIIPIGRFNGSDGATKQNYIDMRQTQIDYCGENENVSLLSIQLSDMSEYGMMIDNFHFKQEAYDIVGKDAGANLGYYAINGKAQECKPYKRIRTTGGAFAMKDGKVVINAAAAFENSEYASTTARYSGSDLYYWKEIIGGVGGAQCLPDTGKNWNTGTGLDNAPQLHYTFNVETPGRYYLYMLTSHPDTGGNSVLACMDYGTLISCAKDSYQEGLWHYDEAWAFDIKDAGEHTLTICCREDGALINQIMLSSNPSEQVVNKQPLEESQRLKPAENGAYVEVNGKVNIDLFSAFGQGSANGYVNKTSSVTGTATDYYWQHGNNGKGVQLLPSGAQWNSGNYKDSPYLYYKVNFTSAGDYYVYLHSSFANMATDSAMIAIDDNIPIELALSVSSSGNNRWLVNENWKLTVPAAGEHTVKIYTRESAATMHSVYLSKTPSDAVGAVPPPVSPRIPQNGANNTVGRDGTLLIKTETNSVDVTFNKAGAYSVYALVNGNWQIQTAVAADNNSVNSIDVPDGAQYLYIVSAEYEREGSIKTLVFGDSYTNRTYWTEFESQMAEVGGVTIGISGSTVNNWLGRINDLLLYNPENIVIHLGVNDINRGDSGETCSQELKQLINGVKAALPNTEIFYVNICDNKYNSSKYGEYAASNANMKAFAEATDKVHYVDYNTVMKENASSMTNSGFLGDNLHPNAQGYELFSRLIKEAIKAVEEGKNV